MENEKDYEYTRPKETIEISFAEIITLIPYVKKDNDSNNLTGQIIEPLSIQHSTMQRRVVKVALLLLKKSSAYERLLGRDENLEEEELYSEEKIQEDTRKLLDNSESIVFTEKYFFNKDKLLILMILMSSYLKVTKSNDEELGLITIAKAVGKDNEIEKRTRKKMKNYVIDYYKPMGWSEKEQEEFDSSENQMIKTIVQEPIFNDKPFYEDLLANETSLLWSDKTKYGSINEQIPDENFDYFIRFLFSVCDGKSIESFFLKNENPFLSYVKSEQKGIEADDVSFKKNVENIKERQNYTYSFDPMKKALKIPCIEEFSLFFGQITRPEYNKEKLKDLKAANTKGLRELNDVVHSYREKLGGEENSSSPLRVYFEEELAIEIKKFKKNIHKWTN